MATLDSFSIVSFPWGREPPTVAELISIARRTEELGFHSFNLPMVNHPSREGPFSTWDNLDTLDPLVVLPALVMATKKIRIIVDGIHLPTMPPFAWAKYFASLDVMSGGRITVGMCLGLSESTFDAAGVQKKYRGRMADEQVEVITRLWTEDHVTHDGKFYQLRNVSLRPKPIQSPLPIWWAGEVKSIPRAARYAEVIDPPWPTVEAVKNEYVPGLARECEKWGTRTKLGGWFYALVTPGCEITPAETDEWFGPLVGHWDDMRIHERSFAGAPAQVADRINTYREAGMEHFVLDFQRHGLDHGNTTIEQMEIFVDAVLPLL